MEPVHESILWSPAEEFSGEAVVCYPVEWSCRHIWPEADLRPMACIAQHFLHRVDDSGSLHRAEIHGRAIVNLFRSEDRAINYIADIRPVSDLLTRAPDFEGVLLHKCTGD